MLVLFCSILYNILQYYGKNIAFSGSEVSSVHTYLPDVNTFSEHLTDHVGEEVSGHATSPPFVYVWLQYAVPKVMCHLMAAFQD